MRLSAKSNRLLRIYAMMPDAEREKLARVRRLSKRMTVRHPSMRSGRGRLYQHPRELQELTTRIGAQIVALKDARELGEAVRRRTRIATYRGVDPGVIAETPPNPVDLAADLEAQAAVYAIELRDRGLLRDGDFDTMTRAWREVGLPL